MAHPATALRPVLARPDLREYIKEIWNRRSFLAAVPRNELRAAKLDTVLGNLWYFVNPALQSLVYILIFGVLLGVDRGIDNYPVFVVIGVLTFNLITTSALNATRAIYGNLYLIRSIYFPRAIVPMTTGMTNLYMFGPALLVMAALTVGTREWPTWRLAFLPCVVAILVVMTFGIVMACGRAGYELPDLYSLLPHLLRLLFYGSGVLFDPTRFTSNDKVILLFELNPAYEVISLMRWCFTARPVDAWMWGAASLWAIVALVVGFLWFWRAEISYGGSR